MTAQLIQLLLNNASFFNDKVTLFADLRYKKFFVNIFSLPFFWICNY